ncbi:MAG: hypothetical protein AAF939_00280 [Planctomycetota bacterium]
MKDVISFEQLIVASTDQTEQSANRVLATSRPFDDHFYDRVCDWCPDRKGLRKQHSHAISFFSLNQNQSAIARSVIGSECFTHGRKQIISKVLVFDTVEMGHFHNNSALLIHHLASHGILNLRFDRSEELKTIEFPFQLIANLSSRSDVDSMLMGEIAQAIELHGMIGLVGIENPLTYVRAVINLLPWKDRSNISFNYGLEIHEKRPFTIHLYKEDSHELSTYLSENRIRRVSPSTLLAEIEQNQIKIRQTVVDA